MTKVQSGACLCGAVRFKIAGAFEHFFLCHCSRCRKDTGSAHASNLFSTRATITWLSGRDHLRTYRVPGTRHQRSFCTECGSPVSDLQAGGALLVVPAGALDTDVGLRPDAHVCVASRATWDTRLEDVPIMDGLPG